MISRHFQTLVALVVLAPPLLLLGGCGSAPKHAEMGAAGNPTLERIERDYGPEARARVEGWKTLVETEQNAPEPEKLRSVNRFFNQLEFVDDPIHWGVADYWATPVETLATNGGDCEDFTLAKYLTLRSLAVPEARMRMSYVKSLTLNQPHMVLAYYPTPEAEPLLLDNIVEAISPASERPDLIPVYSFNGSGLWLARQRSGAGGGDELVGSDRQVGLWQEFLQRVRTEQERDWGFISPALAAPPPR